MTDQQQHPTIAPPRELIAKWMTEARSQDYCSITEQVAYHTAQWVYEQCGKVNEAQLQKARDQELEACCKWLIADGCPGRVHSLRAARRPKPPSLKERLSKAIVEGDERQALKLLEELDDFLEHSQHHPPRTGGAF